MRLQSYRLEGRSRWQDYVTRDEAQMARGKLIFAEIVRNAIRASVRPLEPTRTSWFRKAVLEADFREGNFFSDDKRYPITKIKSNAARACATNANVGTSGIRSRLRITRI